MSAMATEGWSVVSLGCHAHLCGIQVPTIGADSSMGTARKRVMWSAKRWRHSVIPFGLQRAVPQRHSTWEQNGLDGMHRRKCHPNTIPPCKWRQAGLTAAKPERGTNIGGPFLMDNVWERSTNVAEAGLKSADMGWCLQVMQQRDAMQCTSFRAIDLNCLKFGVSSSWLGCCGGTFRSCSKRTTRTTHITPMTGHNVSWYVMVAQVFIQSYPLQGNTQPNLMN